MTGDMSREWCNLRRGWLLLRVWPLAKKEIEMALNWWLLDIVELAKVGGGLVSMKVIKEGAKQWMNLREEVVE